MGIVSVGCGYMVLVYVSLPLIAWILSGGLRRKWPMQIPFVTIPIIVIQQSASPPPPPQEPPRDHQLPPDDDIQSFGA